RTMPSVAIVLPTPEAVPAMIRPGIMAPLACRGAPGLQSGRGGKPQTRTGPKRTGRSPMAASWRASLSTFLMLLSSAAIAAPEKHPMVSEDLFVPHRSTLAAIKGQLVGLHVRHKGPEQAGKKIVLFV